MTYSKRVQNVIYNSNYNPKSKSWECLDCNEDLIEDNYNLLCPECGKIIKHNFSSETEKHPAQIYNPLLNYNLWMKRIFATEAKTSEIQQIINDFKKENIKTMHYVIIRIFAVEEKTIEIQQIINYYKKEHIKRTEDLESQLDFTKRNIKIMYNVIKRIFATKEKTIEIQQIINYFKKEYIATIHNVKERLLKRNLKHAPLIFLEVCGIGPPKVSDEKLRICRFMFRNVLESYKKEYKKNGPSYAYIIYRIFDFLEEKEILDFISLPKKITLKKLDKQWKELNLFKIIN